MVDKKKTKPAERKSSARKPKSAKPKKAPTGGKKVNSEPSGRGFTVSLRGDRSLQAYKTMIRRMTLALNPDAKETLTEKQWVEGWKKFWAKADEKKKAGADEPSSAPVKENKTIEEQYPGITEQIRQFKEMELPSCPHCGSGDTASVRAGVIGRSMTIGASTRKIKLVMNRTDEMGKYFCNNCGKYYD